MAPSLDFTKVVNWSSGELGLEESAMEVLAEPLFSSPVIHHCLFSAGASSSFLTANNLLTWKVASLA